MTPATAWGWHMPDPSTNATACAHLAGTNDTHTAHHPSGSPGGRTTGDVMPASSTTRHTRRMTWDRTRARDPRYGRDHQRTRAAHMTALRRAGAGLCAEPVCLHRSRIITPDMDLHLSHAPDGVTVLGLSHADCNVHEAAVRGRRTQQRRRGHRASRLRW